VLFLFTIRSYGPPSFGNLTGIQRSLTLLLPSLGTAIDSALINPELTLFLFFIDAYSDLVINDLPTILFTVLAINDNHTLSVKHDNILFISSERGMGIFNLASSSSRMNAVEGLLKVCTFGLSVEILWPSALG